MKMHFLAKVIVLFAVGGAVQASTLRVSCDGQAVGAEVSIDGKFKGECPIDLQLKAGQFTLKAAKTISGKPVTFTQSIRLGDDVVKRVEVLLGDAPASVSGGAIPVDMNAVADERYRAELLEYDRSIQGCLPKHATELRRVKQAARAGFQERYRECKQRFSDKSDDYTWDQHYRMMCGTGNMDDGLSQSEKSDGENELDKFNTDAQSWCRQQFTKPTKR